MADRIAVMRSGRIEQIGSPVDVYRRPETPFVSSFVGNVNRVATRWNPDGTVSVLGTEVVGSAYGERHGPAVALIRPDDIALRLDERGPATVESMVLRGSITSVNLRTADEAAPLRVDLASRDALTFSVGDRVRPSVELAHVIVESDAEVVR